MRWTLKPEPNPNITSNLAQELGVDNTIAKLLVQRGIETFEQAKSFFRPSLENLHNPYLMKDMDRAVERIESAIKNGENILVFGDYDVDGTTSVSLMASYLKAIHPNIATYIPDRYDEGYGVSYQGIDYAEDNNIPNIVIAGDTFHTKSIIHALAQSVLLDFVKSFPELNFIIIDGNHDMSSKSGDGVSALRCLDDVNNVDMIHESKQIENIAFVPWHPKKMKNDINMLGWCKVYL